MRVLVIRHAEQVLPFPLSPEDPPLSPIGHIQATQLAVSLRAYKLDRVVCSSMQRAMATARPLAQVLDAPLVRESDLVEIAMGALAPWGPDEQREWASITARWQVGEFDAACPGGESLKDVIMRVRPVVTRLVADSCDCGFALVAHAVVNGVVLSTLCRDLRSALGVDLGHSHASVWELEGHGLDFRVVRRNDVSHLEGEASHGTRGRLGHSVADTL